tara:strand:+ start:553 stop:972 length:420 start_codon:yes stop_codon:yes gene_type:complete
MSELRYFINIPGTPIPRAVKFSRFGSYNTKRVRNWMDLVRDMAKVEVVSKRLTADKGIPVNVFITAHMPLPKATAKKRIPDLIGNPHIKTPDTDNLIKPIKDALTEANVWADDNQVWKIQATKIYCRPGQGRAEVSIFW